MKVPGTFILSSPNGKVIQTITNVSVEHGMARFERVTAGWGGESNLDGTIGSMTDDEMLVAFLEGRAFRLGEV